MFRRQILLLPNVLRKIEQQRRIVFGQRFPLARVGILKRVLTRRSRVSQMTICAVLPRSNRGLTPIG